MKNSVIKLFVLLVVISFNDTSVAQESKVDSLNRVVMETYRDDFQKAKDDLLDLLSESEISEDIAFTKNNLGIVTRFMGDYEESKKYSEAAFSLTNDNLIKASALNNLGAIDRNLGLYEASLKSYLDALIIYEQLEETGKAATVNNNIGMVYNSLSMNEKAIEYHSKAIEQFEALNNKKGMSEAYNNIAIIYANEGDLKKALNYFQYSLKIEEELGDKKGIAESQNNVGLVHYFESRIDSALYYFKESARLEKLMGNEAGVAASYNNIAQVLMENERLNESKTYIDSAYYFAEKSKTSQDVEAALLNYTDYYERKGEVTTAINYHKRFAKYRDSILKKSNLSNLQEMEVKYQTEKKENTILEQRASLAESELKIKQRNNLIYGSLGLALILGLLGYLLYNQQKLKNRQLKKEAELSTALARIETQNRLQEQRLRISSDLHDNIGAQLTFIISSIDNLKFGMKDAKEATKNRLSKISEFTTQTIYELRDTIWAMNKEDISFEDLQVRISNFIEKANTASDGVDFSFSIADGVNKEYTFTSVEGMNIYRIIQESVNNALKYANASNISVYVCEALHLGDSSTLHSFGDEAVRGGSKPETTTIVFTIKDNGIGFNPKAVEKGNGFNTITKRAREIGGEAVISSEIEKGTTVTLQL